MADFTNNAAPRQVARINQITGQKELILLDNFNIKITKTHTDFQTAGLDSFVQLFLASAGEKIYDVFVEPTEAFAGAGITAYTIEVGIVGDTTRYAPVFDVIQGETPPNPTPDQQDNDNADVQSWTGIMGINATARANVNLNNSTDGIVIFYIRTKEIKPT